MRKTVIPVLLLALLAGVLAWNSSVTAVARKDEQKLYLWANDLSRKPDDPPYLSLYYRFRNMYFSVEPCSKHSIVFLGDSITDEGDWSELFPAVPVENRGIGGDTTLGVINRLNEVIAAKPAEIFLMIGTNDLCFGRPIPEIISNYRFILTRFQAELPSTKVYVESVLPFNDTLFPSRSLRTNDNISRLNVQIKELAKEYDYRYIDLSPAFIDSDGRLPVKYTRDGLHLNDAGYLIWREQIKGLVKI